VKITPALLLAAVGCTRELAELYAPHLDAACAHYQVDSAARLAAFLAQVGHESGSFRWTREIWGPTPAQLRYEGRADLGNTRPGDGSRYRGRGLIQITGRDNYRLTAQRMQPLDAPDFEDFPEALEEPRWAAWSAADWWAWRGLNGMANVGEFDAITRRINGGQNGAADRRARWERAIAALAIHATAAPEQPAVADPGQPAAHSHYMSPGEAPERVPPTPPPEKHMPIAPIIAALLPSIIEAIPKLGRVFGSGSEVAERNIKAAELVVETVKSATGAVNAQDAVERLRADPVAVQAATKAIDGIWFDLTEAGGGGVDGARKADAAQRQAGDLLHSASFWVGLMLVPLVYLLVLSLIGMIGTATWSDDVRAGLAGSLISAIIGGLVGYYFGQTTSRNRAPAP
jgi:putative chitinase